MDRIHTVIECDEPAAQRGEHNVRIFAAFDVVSSQSGKVLAQYQIDLSGGGVRNQAVEIRPVKRRTRNPVITICVIQIPTLFPHIPAEHFTLIFDGNGFACSLVVTAEPAINSDIVSFLHLNFYDLLGRRHIASVTCCYYTRFRTLKQ